MYSRRVWLALLAAASITAGCSDDTGNDKKDMGAEQGIQVDKGTPGDEGGVVGREAGPTPDVLVDPDVGSPATCDPNCLKVAPVLCTPHPSEADKCVECTSSGHCEANGDSFGPECENMLCGCSAHSQCAQNPWGKKCSTDKICSCEEHGDCPTGKVCAGSIQGTQSKVCVDACTKDADCPGDGAPICDTDSGQCVACKANEDCKEDYAPYCDTATNSCVECTEASQCADNMLGNACTGGSCGCETNEHCKGKNPWGNKCVEKDGLGGSKYKACGCDATTDCDGNANGPTCYADFKKCSCDAGATTAECTGDYSACSFPYDGAKYSHCQKPCTKDDECTATGLGTCDTNSGRCVGCLSNADCDSDSPICDPTGKTCVACLTETDCDSDMPYCSDGECVECKTAADCTDSKGGKACDSGACTCATNADCGGQAWGNKCVDVFLGIKRCACDSSTDCANNANGEVCEDQDYNICTCSKDSECKDADYSKCGSLFPNAPVNTCQKPCAANSDCKAEGLGICDVPNKLCIGCTKNEDCTYNKFETTCNSSAKACVECLQTSDCGSANAFGPECDTVNNYCVCKDNTECANNENGKVCDSSLAACSCVADTDCPSGKKCTGSYGDIAVCE